MSFSPYAYMQMAVDIVNDSPHPTNKIAATLAGENFHLSRTNHWPPAIERTLGADTRIGNSSGTLHAETACILAAGRPTESAAIFITDPPCPNCAKNIAEAGIKTLYIDHKGFDKDWAQRRSGDFGSMSMRIFEHAGISVYELWRKENRLEPIWEAPQNFVPPDENPIILEDANAPPHEFERAYASATGTDRTGNTKRLTASTHPVIGYTSETLDKPEGKYSYLQQPVNRVLMAAARYGIKIAPDGLFSKTTPTARELVNVVGAGLTQITIAHPNRARDEFGPMALEQLRETGILVLSSTITPEAS